MKPNFLHKKVGVVHFERLRPFEGTVRSRFFYEERTSAGTVTVTKDELMGLGLKGSETIRILLFSTRVFVSTSILHVKNQINVRFPGAVSTIPSDPNEPGNVFTFRKTYTPSQTVTEFDTAEDAFRDVPIDLSRFSGSDVIAYTEVAGTGTVTSNDITLYIEVVRMPVSERLES